jgi:hypothetical protein
MNKKGIQRVILLFFIFINYSCTSSSPENDSSFDQNNNCLEEKVPEWDSVYKKINTFWLKNGLLEKGDQEDYLQVYKDFHFGNLHIGTDQIWENHEELPSTSVYSVSNLNKIGNCLAENYSDTTLRALISKAILFPWDEGNSIDLVEVLDKLLNEVDDFTFRFLVVYNSLIIMNDIKNGFTR